MLDAITRLFSKRDSRQEARLGLARIISRYDMIRLCYEEGINVDRRSRDERHIALGIWLFPCAEDATAEDFDINSGVPAVTHDLRCEGIGVMTPLPMDAEHYVVAAPDENGGWRFFKCEVRHSTKKPGGWHLLGLQVDNVLDLDGSTRRAFREYIARICGEIE